MINIFLAINHKRGSLIFQSDVYGLPAAKTLNPPQPPMANRDSLLTNTLNDSSKIGVAIFVYAGTHAAPSC